MFTFKSFSPGIFSAASLVCFAAVRAQAIPFQRSTPYTFQIPRGWASTTLGDGGTIVTQGDAYVRIVRVEGGGKDDTRVKRVVDQVGAQWKQFREDSRGTLKLAGNNGIYVFISGVNPKGVAATMRIDAAPFGEDAYMLIMSAPSQDFFGIKAAFQQIENSFAVSSGNTPSPGSDTLPANAAPNGFNSANGAEGGRILFTNVSGSTNGLDIFRAGLGKLQGYFDASPKLVSAVSSKDHTLTLAVFNARLKGRTVAGFLSANYDQAGNSYFAAVFDNPDHLKTSLSPMMRSVHEMAMAHIEQARPTAGGTSGPAIDFAKYEAAASKISLNRVQYPRGIGSVGIAPGYKPTLLDSGSCLAMGEDGSYLNLMGNDAILDPRGTLYQTQLALAHNIGRSEPMPIPGQVFIEYDKDPVSVWKKYITAVTRQRGKPDLAPVIQREKPYGNPSSGWTGKLVSGTMTIEGETFAFTGSLMTSPPPSREGAWSLGVTILAAPVKNAARDFPALFAMSKSVKLDIKKLSSNTMQDMEQRAAETSRWLAENKAAGDALRNSRFESSMANARASREVMDRSTANFILHISDEAIVQNNNTGASARVSSSIANLLTSGNSNLSQVPVSQLQAGVHY